MKKGLLMLLITLAVMVPVSTGAEVTELKVGDSIASFNANTDQGELWRLSDHLSEGKYLVVYFYPAAMTGGCTAEACGYRDAMNDLNDLNVEVVGVSGDAVNGIKVFKQAYHLNFTLLSDINGTIAQRFGVPTRDGGSLLRTLDNRQVTLNRGQSSSRWTFVLDGHGKVVFKNTQVDAAQDAAQVIAFIRSKS